MKNFVPNPMLLLPKLKSGPNENAEKNFQKRLKIGKNKKKNLSILTNQPKH